MADKLGNPALRSLPVLGCDGMTSVGKKLVDENRLAATVIVPTTADKAIELVVADYRNEADMGTEVLLPPRGYPDDAALIRRNVRRLSRRSRRSPQSLARPGRRVRSILSAVSRSFFDTGFLMNITGPRARASMTRSFCASIPLISTQGRVGMVGERFPQDLEPVAAGHEQVHEERAVRRLAHSLERVPGIGAGVALPAQLRHGLRQEQGLAPVVVDDQDLRLALQQVAGPDDAGRASVSAYSAASSSAWAPPSISP
jgi:hypothetical protein